jgi:hypothetical protein
MGQRKKRQNGEEGERNGGDHDGTSLPEAASRLGSVSTAVLGLSTAPAPIRWTISRYIAHSSKEPARHGPWDTSWSRGTIFLVGQASQ